MKYIILSTLLCTFFHSYAQVNKETEKAILLEKVNLFFKALEFKDTTLYKSLMYPQAQIWSLRTQNDTIKTAMRSFREDMLKLPTLKWVLQERVLSSDIKIHNNIAVAWIPYTLSLSGTFSHCGVDVFTFLNSADGWKIVSIVYSVEPDGCDTLK